MPENYRIFIVDDITETRENIIKLLQFEPDIEVVGSFGSGKEAIDIVRSVDPDVILMDINMPDMDGITATELVRRANPTTQIIILSVQGDANYMRRAMLAGARDYLTKPPMTDDLVSALRRAGDMARSERAKLAEQALFLKNMTQVAFKKRDGKVIMVYSPKGGTGVTTIAVNLGFALNTEETPVLILDSNFQFGDVPVFINEHAKSSILDLATRSDELEPEFVDEVVSRHSKSSIRFLAAPPRLEQSEDVLPEQYSAVLASLREMYSYVVIDSPHIVNEVTLASIDHADIIVLLVTQDIPALRNTQIFLDLLTSLKIPKSKIIMAMNKFDKRISITTEKVSENLKMVIPISIGLDEKTVLTSVNRGIPFTQEPNQELVTQQVIKLSEIIVEKISQKE
jgi:pilus assembly protein CpaE